MAHRIVVTLLVSSLVLLLWVLLSAFRPDRAGSWLARPDEASPIALPPEDLALLEEPASASRPALDARPLAQSAPASAAAPVMAPKTAEPAAGVPAHLTPDGQTADPGRAVSGNPGDHRTHKKSLPMPPAVKRRQRDTNQSLPTDSIGRARLDWDVIAGTQIDDQFRPTFPENLRTANGRPVTLSGFMTPLDEVGSLTVFLLLEFPVGCFYCQTPDPTGVVLVELRAGRHVALSYDRISVTGTLKLNQDDPEDFLYSVTDANLSQAD